MLAKWLPILDWLPKYKRDYLAGDLGAGLTVGIMLVPQGMAYAMIAGLPPVFGLYAAMVPQIIYAMMGTSRHLAVGPVAMDSLLVAAGLGTLGLSGIDEYISMAIFLALFMGVIQLLLGLLRMGFLVNFLSRPVISGFTSAAAIIIGLSQLKHLLGTEIESSSQVHLLVLNAIETLDQLNPYSLVIGLAAILIILGLKRLKSKIPAALLVVVLGISAAYYFDLASKGVNIVRDIPGGLPALGLPSAPFSKLDKLLPIALTLAFIAFLEAISVAKAVADKSGDYEVNANQELRALGMSNIIGSFFQAYPTTGGFSRTAVNVQAGARTGMASLVSALVVGLTLLFLTPLFYYLPSAILAGIIIVAVLGLIDVKFAIKLFRKRKDEFLLLLVTFLMTLIIGIKEGILLGVLFSLLLLVYRTSRPHIAVLGRIRGTHYFRNIDRFEAEVEPDSEVAIIRFDGQLYFGNKDYFKSQVSKILDQRAQKPNVIIVKAEPINYIDSSAVFMLEKLIIELRDRGITLVFSDVIGPTRDIIQKSGLLEKIGKEHFFVNTKEAYEFARHQIPKSDIQDKIALQTQFAKPSSF